MASISGEHGKSAIHGLPVKSSKSDWLRIRDEDSAHTQNIRSEGPWALGTRMSQGPAFVSNVEIRIADSSLRPQLNARIDKKSNESKTLDDTRYNARANFD